MVSSGCRSDGPGTGRNQLKKTEVISLLQLSYPAEETAISRAFCNGYYFIPFHVYKVFRMQNNSSPLLSAFLMFPGTNFDAMYSY